MMRSLHESEIHSQEDAKEYVGIMFRPKLYELPEWKTNKEVCEYMIRFELIFKTNLFNNFYISILLN